jgi:hypothetical protein
VRLRGRDDARPDAWPDCRHERPARGSPTNAGAARAGGRAGRSTSTAVPPSRRVAAPGRWPAIVVPRVDEGRLP